MEEYSDVLSIINTSSEMYKCSQQQNQQYQVSTILYLTKKNLLALILMSFQTILCYLWYMTNHSQIHTSSWPPMMGYILITTCHFSTFRVERTSYLNVLTILYANLEHHAHTSSFSCKSGSFISMTPISSGNCIYMLYLSTVYGNIALNEQIWS